MARIIELSGSAGAGKSTTYREMAAKWKNEFGWIPAHKLLPQQRITDARNFNEFVINIAKIIIKGDGAIDTNLMLEAGKRFVAQYPEFMNVCWRNIYMKQRSSLNGLDHRFDKTSYLLKLLQRVQILKEKHNNKIALLDEGSIKMIDVLSNTCIGVKQEMEEIIHVMEVLPLPDALIYIETDASENAIRLMKRGGYVAKVHRLLNLSQLEKITRESQERKAFVNEILRKKRVPILDIDSKVDVKTNVHKTLEFLESANLFK